MVTEVRRARIDDAAGIASVHVASWQAAYRHAFPPESLASLSVAQREEQCRVALSDSDEAIFVAEADGAVVGFVATGASRDGGPAEGRVGELHAIYVRADYWGTETGARLHDAALDALLSAGFAQATLWVLDSNKRARQFYERRGWAPDGGAKHEELGGTPIVEVRYRRDLNVNADAPRE